MPLSARLQIFDGKLANHAVPASLRHVISDDDWEVLAFAVEDALAVDVRFQWIGLSVCLGIPLLGVLTTGAAMTVRQSRAIRNGGDFDIYYNPFALLGFLPPILIITMMVMMLVQHIFIRPRVSRDVHEVLAEASSTYPGVSFRLMGHGSRTDPFYIEVFEESSSAYGYYNNHEANGASHHNRNDSEEMGNHTSTTVLPSTRLEELVKVKYLLSTQEYKDKREAILANL